MSLFLLVCLGEVWRLKEAIRPQARLRLRPCLGIVPEAADDDVTAASSPSPARARVELLPPRFQLPTPHRLPVPPGAAPLPPLLLGGPRGYRCRCGFRCRPTPSTSIEVVVGEPARHADLPSFARVVNSCDVLVGMHGVRLANLVFLPAGAVVVQVAPLGGLDAMAAEDFGAPARDAWIRYVHYGIAVEESTLARRYRRVGDFLDKLRGKGYFEQGVPSSSVSSGEGAAGVGDAAVAAASEDATAAASSNTVVAARIARWSLKR